MAELGTRLESFNDTPVQYKILADNRQADRSASLDDVTSYIYESLIDYQGKWEKSDAHSWAYTFPYARYLAVNDEIKNMNTVPYTVYTIAEIINAETNTVKLSGSTKPSSGDRLELADNNMVNFISAYPHEQADPRKWKDAITYKVSRREPGSLATHPFDVRKEIKPRTRQTIVDPDNHGYHINIMGQWFDNILQFEFWTTTANGGDSLITWFEDFMYKYTWVWKKNGVQEILYNKRGIDEESTKWRNDLNYRSLWYFFRTEKIVTIKEKDFSQIDLTIGLSSIIAPEPSGVTSASGILEIIDGGL